MKKSNLFLRFISILTAVLLLSAIFLTSCGKTDGTDYNIDVDTYNIDDSGRTVSIVFPVMEGTDNDTAVNEALKNASLNEMELYLLYSGSDGFYRYTIDSVAATYESDRLASFICVGSYTDEGSAHPDTIIYTINVNPNTGALYKFEDLISDFDLLAGKFRAGEFQLADGIDNLLEKTNYEDMFVGYSSLYKIYPPVYFINDNGTAQLAFSVGLVYDLGGHAEFSVDAQSVKSALTNELCEILSIG